MSDDLSKVFINLGKDLEKEVRNNLQELGDTAKTNMNALAPYYTGALTESAKVVLEKDSVTIIWDTPYARRRYFENELNPETKEWVDQDLKLNTDKYLEILTKGIGK